MSLVECMTPFLAGPAFGGAAIGLGILLGYTIGGVFHLISGLLWSAKSEDDDDERNLDTLLMALSSDYISNLAKENGSFKVFCQQFDCQVAALATGVIGWLAIFLIPAIPCLLEGWLQSVIRPGNPPPDSELLMMLPSTPAPWDLAEERRDPAPPAHRPPLLTAAGPRPVPSAPVSGQPTPPAPVHRQPATALSPASCIGAPDQAPVTGPQHRHCASVLSHDTCPPGHWRVLNTDNVTSVCVPRLCGPGRVFIAGDQMCHDVREPSLCEGGLRPYLTAAAAPVCDCDEGQYRDAAGQCVDLFTSSGCPQQQSVQISEDGQPRCVPDPCSGLSAHAGGGSKYADVNQRCYEYGTRGPCDANAVLAFSLRLLKPICARLTEPLFADVAVTSQSDVTAGPLTSPRAGPDWVTSSGSRQRPGSRVTVTHPLLTRCRAASGTDGPPVCRDIMFPGRFNKGSGEILQPVWPNFRCDQGSRLTTDGGCVTESSGE